MNGDKTRWTSEEYWQHRFEVSDTPWDLGRASSVLIEAMHRADAFGLSVAGASAIIAGAGRGSDALELVRRGATVLAVEWSGIAASEMQTRYNQQKRAMTGTLEVSRHDFFTLAPRLVDLAAEHTFLCAIDPSMRASYASTIAGWIRPHGLLIGNFFIISDEEAARLSNLSLTASGDGPPFGITAKELRALLTPYFEECLLEPSPIADPGRRLGLEWVGIFRRRNS
jgi:hypothetical protein